MASLVLKVCPIIDPIGVLKPCETVANVNADADAKVDAIAIEV